MYDAVLTPVLTMRVTTAVLTLGQLAATGDEQALEQLEAMAALVEGCGHG